MLKDKITRRIISSTGKRLYITTTSHKLACISTAPIFKFYRVLSGIIIKGVEKRGL